jgi:hypothetical protein
MAFCIEALSGASFSSASSLGLQQAAKSIWTKYRGKYGFDGGKHPVHCQFAKQNEWSVGNVQVP